MGTENTLNRSWRRSVPTSLIVGGLLGALCGLAAGGRSFAGEIRRQQLCNETGQQAIAISADELVWKASHHELYDAARCEGGVVAVLKERRQVDSSYRASAWRAEPRSAAEEARIAQAFGFDSDQRGPAPTEDGARLAKAWKPDSRMIGIGACGGIALGILLWFGVAIADRFPALRSSRGQS